VTLIAQITDPPNNYLPQILMFGGVMMVMFILVTNAKRRYRERQRGQNLSARERLERVQQESVMKNDLRTMMVELEDLTRRFSAQLDAKSVRLDHMMQEADAKMAQLRQMIEAAGGDPNTATPTNDNTSQVEALPEAVQAPAPSAADANPDSSEVSAPVEATPTDEDDPLKRRIYELDDGGQTSVEIATELGEHVGKVELILALRGQAST
jgi:hypothetical protein